MKYRTLFLSDYVHSEVVFRLAKYALIKRAIVEFSEAFENLSIKCFCSLL